MTYTRTCDTVSVPSRGILFPNSIENHRSNGTYLTFPSPLGVSYFQIERAISLSTVLASFRPLSGYLISKYKMKLQSVCSRNIVSVPSRGILFPNAIDFADRMWKMRRKFPSPLGVSYFQMQKKFGIVYHVTVSVPSRGILFPNRLVYGYTATSAKFPSPLGVSYFQILPARARYFAGFSDSFAWQIIFLYIFLISNIHNRLQMQYLCGARQNYLFF